MRVMVLIRADEIPPAGRSPDANVLGRMEAYNQELVKAGVLLAGEGLKPSAQGKRVRITRERRTVTDGPFQQGKDLVAGFWLWQVSSMEEAVEWVKRMPDLRHGGEPEVEIRPVYEAAADASAAAPPDRGEDGRADEPGGR